MNASTEPERFGIPPALYGMLAETGLLLEKVGHLELVELVPHADGRAGGTLYRAKPFLFSLLECPADQAPTLQLSSSPLDSVRPFHSPLLFAPAQAYSGWLKLASFVLTLEELGEAVTENFNQAFQDKMQRGFS